MIGYFIQNWETPVISDSEIKQPYDYGIVLGGFSNFYPQSKRIQFNCKNDRLMQTLHLYATGKIKKIIIASGSGRIFNQKEKESVYVKDYLMDLEIPEADICIEDQSKNTHENARNVAFLFGNDTSSYLLITSAFHMKRAKLCFNKAGMNIDPFPVDFEFGPEKEKGFFCGRLLPNSHAFELWNQLLKEWIGYLRELFL